MKDGKRRILSVNPGSTSMKIAVYDEKELVVEKNLKINLLKIIKDFSTYKVDKDSELMKIVYDFLDSEGIDLTEVDMIVSRGGPSAKTKSGAYTVNKLLRATYKYSPEGLHGSMVGPAVCTELARPYGIPVIAYDFDVTDEADPLPHYTGIPEIQRSMATHLLNGRMVCRNAAEKLGRKYEDMNIVIAHIGGGISVTAHEKGRVIDSNLVEDGPMAPTRCGRMPNNKLIDLCFSGKYTREELQEFVMQRGGLMAHLGTSDAREVEKKIADGDEHAKLIYHVMIYQISKNIGEMAVALKGDVDVILLTGGIAHSKMVTDWIQEYVSFLAPVMIFPGGDEMRALTLGGLLVLDKKEPLKEYDIIPTGYDSVEEFYKAFNIEGEDEE
jgi:butyrate kinase